MKYLRLFNVIIFSLLIGIRLGIKDTSSNFYLYVTLFLIFTISVIGDLRK